MMCISARPKKNCRLRVCYLVVTCTCTFLHVIHCSFDVMAASFVILCFVACTAGTYNVVCVSNNAVKKNVLLS